MNEQEIQPSTMSSLKVLTDSDLLILLKNDEKTAFDMIYDRYWNKLYYVAYKILKSTEASEEIVQDVFLLLWRKKEMLNIQSLPVYLAAMVRYEVYRYIAKEKKSKEHHDYFQLQKTTYSCIDEVIENKILLEIVTELSNQLPEKCRLVFQYNKLQDRPLAEVAEELNISLKTAEAHLTKGLKVIRGHLKNVMNIFFL